MFTLFIKCVFNCRTIYCDVYIIYGRGTIDIIWNLELKVKIYRLKRGIDPISKY